MKPLLLVLAGAAPAVSGQSPDPKQDQMPGPPCADLQPPTIPNATIVSFQTAERRNITLAGGGSMGGGTDGTAALAPLDICDVNITLTHGAANDSVRIEVWMPLVGWNGRFQGTGGGGFVAGTFGAAMAPQVARGFAAASTDAGLRPASFDGRGIAFDGQLMANFASLSAHEMALVGKAVTRQFYGGEPVYSYWNGCSTGGRQGYMEAQVYPEDFDGILAAAPAINWDKFCPAEFWPFQVQSEAGEFVPTCVLTALTQANIRACDGLDGALDGMISDPSVCRFDAHSMFGTSVACGNNDTATISAAQASIYNRIIRGPVSATGAQLWFGVEPGTSLNFLAGTTPFSLGATWLDTFVANRTQLDGRLGPNSTLTARMYSSLFQASVASRFGSMLATDNADLSGLQAAGHKLLSWHGLADPIIMPQGSFDYRRRVEAKMGGAVAVDQFYRLFTAPGVGHCGGGGPSPDTLTAIQVLMNWVEKGVAPDTLPASAVIGNVTVTRNLCRYPFVARFTGSGNVNSTEGWICSQSGGLEVSGSNVVTVSASLRVGVWRSWLVLGVLSVIWWLLQ